jgi:preprotein translocase subunit YajC
MLTILAQTTTTEAATTGSSGSNVVTTLILYAVVIGGLFYFLMIRPQRTRMKRHEEMMSGLAVGDEVQTVGGIYGRIEFMDESTAIIQVEGGGRLRVARRALAGKAGE